MDVHFSMATRKDKDSSEHATSGVMHFPDGTPQWLAYGFLAFAKVKLQGQFRRKGIPASWKGDAEKLAPGARDVGALPPEQQVSVSFSQMTREQQREFLKAQAERLEAEEMAELEKETNPE